MFFSACQLILRIHPSRGLDKELRGVDLCHSNIATQLLRQIAERRSSLLSYAGNDRRF